MYSSYHTYVCVRLCSIYWHTQSYWIQLSYVTGFAKRVLYSHPNFQIYKSVTPPMIKLQFWNFVQCFPYHWSCVSVNFESLAQSHAKLCLLKVQKSDASIRPLFPNPVTIMLVTSYMPVYHDNTLHDISCDI